VTDSANDSDWIAQERNPDTAGHRPSVLVVGAGPIGLLLASELQRRRVPCHLIDTRPAPLHWDRATVVHPRSLEIFESLGIVGQFLETGARQRTIKIHSRGKVNWNNGSLQLRKRLRVQSRGVGGGYRIDTH
jgi:2-polyprenyl-6-methoxyphenol hydroxylase-like FAD-dependent oxidoreductase